MNYYIIEQDDKLILMKVADDLNEAFLKENKAPIIAQARSIAEALMEISKVKENNQLELLEPCPVRFKQE